MKLELRRRTVPRAGAPALAGPPPIGPTRRSHRAPRWQRPLALLHLLRATILFRWRAPSREDAGDTVPLATGGRFGYRLRAWPALPVEHRTAAVYRALSVMGERVVSVTWLARHTGFALPQAQEILDWLAQEGYAQQIPLTVE